MNYNEKGLHLNLMPHNNNKNTKINIQRGDILELIKKEKEVYEFIKKQIEL